VKRWAQGQILVCWHEGKTHGGKAKGDNSKPGLQVLGNGDREASGADIAPHALVPHLHHGGRAVERSVDSEREPTPPAQPYIQAEVEVDRARLPCVRLTWIDPPPHAPPPDLTRVRPQLPQPPMYRHSLYRQPACNLLTPTPAFIKFGVHGGQIGGAPARGGDHARRNLGPRTQKLDGGLGRRRRLMHTRPPSTIEGNQPSEASVPHESHTTRNVSAGGKEPDVQFPRTRSYDCPVSRGRGSVEHTSTGRGPLGTV